MLLVMNVHPELHELPLPTPSDLHLRPDYIRPATVSAVAGALMADLAAAAGDLQA